MLCLPDILLYPKQKDNGIYFIVNGNEYSFVSYAHLLHKALVLLNGFYHAGVVAGDEMILVEEDSEGLLVAFWACILGKIVPVPVSAGVKDGHKLKLYSIWNELRRPYIYTRQAYLDKWVLYAAENGLEFRHYKPEHRFYHSQDECVLAPVNIADLPEVSPSDLAFIQYSSGSTGTPKGVMLSHANLICNLSDITERTQIKQQDEVLSWIPLTHDLGMIAFHLSSSYAGCNQYIMPTALFIRRPLLWMELADKFKATISYSPNFGYQYFLDALSRSDQFNWNLASLRTIVNGAEPILADVCRRFTYTLAVYGLPEHVISPSYGLAEASVGVSGYLPGVPLKEYFIPRPALQRYRSLGELRTTAQPGDVSFICVGTGSEQCHFRICGEQDEVLPPATIGHVQIKGGNVTSGYYNSSLNADLFTEDGWLRTGDLGFVNEWYELVITGREKNMIILQGQNYYSHDIEKLLFGIDDISLGKVVACADAGKGNEKELFIVFVLYKKPLSKFVEVIKAINARLTEQLGLAPDMIIPVKEIPKTTSGKVQHHELIDGYRRGYFADELAELGTLYDTRSRLTELWKSVFRNEEVAPSVDFFAAGGNSMLAIQLLSQIAIHFNRHITVKQLFENASVDKLEKLLLQPDEGGWMSKIPAATVRPYYPLSHQQLRVWTMEQVAGTGTMHHIYKAFRFNTVLLNTHWLQEAVHRLVKRHEVLRTLIGEWDGEPGQTVLPAEKLRFFFRHAVEEGRMEAEVLSTIRAPFNLEEESAFAVHLFVDNNGNGVLLFLMHHIIGDGWSAQVILSDLQHIYNALASDSEDQLPLLKLHYKDYASWQRNAVQEQMYAQQQQLFWQQQLQQLPPRLQLPSLPVGKEQVGYAGRSVKHVLPASLAHQIIQVAGQQQVSVFTVLLAITKVLFYKYSGLDDILVGTTVSGRNNAELQHQVGLYINTVPLRTRLQVMEGFLPLLHSLRDTLTGILDHQEYPFDMILEALQEQAGANVQQPLFDVLVEFQAFDHEAAEVVLHNATLSPWEIHNGTALAHLDMEFVQSGDVLFIRCGYNTAVYSEEHIARMLAAFEQLAGGLLNAPANSLSSFSVMTKADHLWLEEMNNSAKSFPLHQPADLLLEAVVRQYADKTALVSGGRTVSYRQLDNTATILCDLLTTIGQVAGYQVTGILMDRSVELVAAIYGGWKAGWAYVPLHPDLPGERMDFMVQDAAVSVLVTEGKYLYLAEEMVKRGVVKHVIVSYTPGVFSWHTTVPATVMVTRAALPANRREELAYIIYTSGSTGKPKGAMVEQQGMVNHLFAKIDLLGLNDNSVVAQNASQSFDISVWQFFAALLVGGTVVVYDQEVILDVPAFISRLEQDKVTVLEVVPSYLSVMLDEMELQPGQSYLCRLLWLVVTGETVKQRLLARWFLLFRVPVVNAYGPTEVSDDITHFVMHQAPEQLIVPIGRVVPNLKIYIVDAGGGLCPRGVSGEIWVSGVGVGKGYINNPVKTQDVFIVDPFCGQPDVRLYKTGDIGRYLPDGNIEFLGRIDQQVKIRGNRIELEEIEAHLVQFPDVKEAAVLVKENGGEQALAAFITWAGATAADIPAIRGWLSRILPEYMIPEQWLVLEHLPLNANGKTDRQQLAALTPAGITNGQVIAPQTATEKVLADIWKQLLQKETVGVNSHFFLTGGQSLKATQLVSQVYRLLKTKISVKNVFEYPELGSLAAYIDRTEHQQFVPIHPVVKNEAGYYPASNAQRRLWLIDQMEDELVAYNSYAAFELNGNLNIPALRNAIEQVVDKYEILRTTFEVADGVLMQRVHGSGDLPVQLEVVDGTNGTYNRETITALLQKRAYAAMDLQNGPLFQATVYLLPDDTSYFFCVMHHIICDGWSNNLLIREVFRNYHAFGQQPEKQHNSTVLPVQYKDFAFWQQQQLVSDEYAAHKQYWQQVFEEEVPVLAMPYSKERPAVKTYKGQTIRHCFSAQKLALLNRLAQKADASLFMVLNALVNVLLYKYTGQRDIVIGTVTSGRNHPDLDEQIGYFLDTVCLRNTIEPEKNLVQWLQVVKQRTLEAFDHQAYPFDLLVNDLHVQREMSRNPLFDIAIVLQNFDEDESSLFKGQLSELQVNTLPLVVEHSLFDIELEFAEQEGALWLYLNYNTNLFEERRMQNLAGHIDLLLEQLERDPEMPVGKLSLLTEAEQQAYHQRFTVEAYPLEQTYFHCMERFAVETPDKTAVVYNDRKLSYGSLNALVNQLARVLNRRAALRSEELVGVFMRRSEIMAAAILAIWKSGAAYVPLERKLPDNRIISILEEAGVKHVVAERECVTETIAEAMKDICVFHYIDELLEEAKVEPTDNYVVPMEVDALAFVLFTSGSTGKPKGAMLEHAGKMNHAYNSVEVFNMNADMKLIQSASHGFDISVWQFFNAFTAGGTTVIYEDALVNDPEAFLTRLLHDKATHLLLVPSYLALLLDIIEADPARYPLSLQFLDSCGEILKPSLVKRWFALFPHIPIVNDYGPTEVSDTVTFYTLYSAEGLKEKVPVGYTLHNMCSYVTDENMNLVPDGIAGELCLAGVGVGRGYLKDTEKTAVSFMTDPFTNRPQRLYKSGDRAIFNEKGILELGGRKDHQVKVNGHRIELGEIEARITQLSSVKGAVVLDKEDEAGKKYLAAYVVPQEMSEVSYSEIKEAIARELPGYMVPHRYHFMEAIPVTVNGKADRRALGAIALQQQEAGEAEAPATREQEVLATAWQQVFQKPVVHLNENFYQAGGDSITAIQLASHISRQGYKAEIRDIMRYPSIKELAPYLRPVTQLAWQEPVIGQVPLTSVQKDFFASDKANKNHYHQSALLYAAAGLKPAAIAAVWHKLQEWHDALRITFTLKDGEVTQYNRPETEWASVEWFEVSAETEVMAFMEEKALELAAAIRLTEGSLARVAVFNTAQGAYLLLIIHHLVIDGVSWRILLEDVTVLYEQALKEEPLVLPAKTDGFKRWSEQLQVYASGEVLAAETEYWKKVYAGICELTLDYENAQPGSINSLRHYRVALTEEDTRLLLTVAPQAFNTDMNDLLLAALTLATQQQFAVGAVSVMLESHGRAELEPGLSVDRTLGWFTSVYPVVLSVDVNQDTGRQIRIVKELLHQVPHKGIGYGLLKHLPDGELKERVRPSILFNYLGQTDEATAGNAFEWLGHMPGCEEDVDNQGEYPVEITGIVNKGRLSLTAFYYPSMFTDATLQQWMNAYVLYLQQLIHYCAAQSGTRLTPSDFAYTSLSLEELEDLNNLLS
ncbi:surfactin family lipopeptide synthetase A/fengycin family lipopeptide synthetase B/lichenysin synthetase A [Filimonas lacunae]|uniref:Surfactin family lipopeptide synthetase A/fengycin family lipopeptide synthetase B/lichenysin synthetase A n=2 Tax=Filimonas lacunae TaxID=477680 RepID=A0A1N7RH86_9BACT|nr:surfactin family lipopeptide synthetase A/fengycin family lipopeptide synthetase B/lichenysin synthetase A [Filimonas lacunae]